MKKCLRILKFSNAWISLLILSFLTFTACKKNCRSDIPKNTPDCIAKEISRIKNEPVKNPAAVVWQYDYNGQTVFYIPASCCDVPGMLFDSNCNLICNPDGGITGNGDGRCSDFFTTRTDEKLIWKDSRK